MSSAKSITVRYARGNAVINREVRLADSLQLSGLLRQAPGELFYILPYYQNLAVNAQSSTIPPNSNVPVFINTVIAGSIVPQDPTILEITRAGRYLCDMRITASVFGIALGTVTSSMSINVGVGGSLVTVTGKRLTSIDMGSSLGFEFYLSKTLYDLTPRQLRVTYTMTGLSLFSGIRVEYSSTSVTIRMVTPA